MRGVWKFFLLPAKKRLSAQLSDLAYLFPLLELKFRTPKTAVDSFSLSGQQGIVNFVSYLYITGA